MILLDNCVPRRYLHLLKKWNYSAVLMSDSIPHDAPDPQVIDLAVKLDAILLTVDLDFSNILDYPPKNFQGIIVLRYQVGDESDLDNTLKTALDDLYRDKLRNCLVIVNPKRYRLRRG